MFRKIWNQVQKVIIMILIRRGYSYISARNYAKGIRRELERKSDLSYWFRIKSIKKGYYSLTYKELLEKKTNQYLIPEFKYYRLHPVNGYYTRWIDDKITIRYILAPFKEYLPDYYYQVNKDNVVGLPDLPDDSKLDFASIINLLKEKRVLACKPYSGSGGDGFTRLEYKNEGFIINNNGISEKDLIIWLENSNGYCITEYVQSEDSLRAINPFSTTTVRILTVRVNNETHIVSGFVRFGTSKSGTVDNIGQGGLMAAIDTNTGKIITHGYMSRKVNFKQWTHHPDTGKAIEGQLKHWNMINEKLKEMGNYHPQLIYIGYDIAITNSGFKIIEMNSLQDILNLEVQMDIPVNDTYAKFIQDKIDEIGK